MPSIWSMSTMSTGGVLVFSSPRLNITSQSNIPGDVAVTCNMKEPGERPDRLIESLDAVEPRLKEVATPSPEFCEPDMLIARV